MTVQGMLDWFDLLQDKFGSPYFEATEKLSFLNNAQNEYVNQVFLTNEGGLINLEVNSNILENVRPLIFELDPFTMDSNGEYSIPTLVTGLQTKSGDATADIFKFLSFEMTRGQKIYPIKFLRHNDKGEFEANYFKKPSYTSPRYLFQNGLIKFRPIDEIASIAVTVLKTPVAMALGPDVDCELPITTHNEVVAYALQFAGVASRDEILSAMNQMQLPK